MPDNTKPFAVASESSRHTAHRLDDQAERRAIRHTDEKPEDYLDGTPYLAFTTGFPKDIAVKIFVKKFHQEPTRIFIAKGLLRVGPEPRRTVAEIAQEQEQEQ